MTFTEKLNALIKERGINKNQLAMNLGMRASTIDSFYTKGYHNTKLSTLKLIAGYFDISLDILTDDSVGLDGYHQNKKLAALGEKYFALGDKSQKIIDSLLTSLAEIERTGSKVSVLEPKSDETRYIREYVTPAAAGYASPAEGADFVLIERTDETPENADFAVRIAGNSMEPHIKDGSRVYVTRTNELYDGDIGIFFVDGDMKCKQFCEDSFGNIHLFSLNRSLRDSDVMIRHDSASTILCFGRVIMPKRIPLPKD